MEGVLRLSYYYNAENPVFLTETGPDFFGVEDSVFFVWCVPGRVGNSSGGVAALLRDGRDVLLRLGA